MATIETAPLIAESAGAVGLPERRSDGRIGLVAKRAIDIIVAAGVLVILAPLFLIMAVAVRLDSRGPALFRQRRIGRDGREFTMLKFRSMSVGAPSDVHREFIAQLAAAGASSSAEQDEGPGELLKLTNDPRVTRVGAFIRATSIDEWPQFINVLFGQMSLVGPRPAMLYELEFYRPEHTRRFEVRPGLTGLWQVSGRNRLGLYDMLDLDVEYVHRRCLSYDVRLALKTPRALLRADTA